MFGYLNRLQIKQCCLVHRKHVKRRIGVSEEKRQFSTWNFSKLGDLYARLGLKSDVSQDDIKKAYYKLSLEHHPDKNQGCKASAEKFRSVTEAYEILGNVASRAQYDRDTPYGKVRHRRQQPHYSAQSSSAYSEKDDELAQKIRELRQNMHRRRRKPSFYEDEEFTYRRENMFDFDAWYRAHFRGDYTEKIRNERATKYAREYQEQMDRLARGENIRPPRPFPRRTEPPSDIEIQMAQMESREFRMHVLNVFVFIGLIIAGLSMAVYIIEANTDKSPWVDPYELRRGKDKAEEEEMKKLSKQL